MKGFGTTIRRGSSTTVAKVAKQVKEIKHQLKNDFALHTNRKIDTLSVKSDFAEQAIFDIEMNTSSRLQGAVANLRYFDPSTPGTLITADASVGNYSRKLSIKNVNSTTILRNNFIVPCNIAVYECFPKDDTSLSPLACMINGLVDQYASTPLTTQPGIFPTDVDQFNEIWGVRKVTTKKLQAGQSYVHKYNSGKYEFDPSVYDSHNLNYQKQWKAAVLLIKIWGDVGHDSTAGANVGLMKCGVDYYQTRTVTIQYDAGTSLNDFSIEDNQALDGANAVLSNKAIADNQPFTAGKVTI